MYINISVPKLHPFPFSKGNRYFETWHGITFQWWKSIISLENGILAAFHVTFLLMTNGCSSERTLFSAKPGVSVVVGKALVKVPPLQTSQSFAFMNSSALGAFLVDCLFINQIYCYICSGHANEVTPRAETQHWFHFLPLRLLPGQLDGDYTTIWYKRRV